MAQYAALQVRDLDLLLELSVPPILLTQFGRLLLRHPGLHAVFDVGGLESVTKTGLGDLKTLDDLGIEPP